MMKSNLAADGEENYDVQSERAIESEQKLNPTCARTVSMYLGQFKFWYLLFKLSRTNIVLTNPQNVLDSLQHWSTGIDIEYWALLLLSTSKIIP